MDKRTFLKTSGALLTGGALSRLLADEVQTEPRTNWSGNYKYSTERLHLPHDASQVEQDIQTCAKPKSLGARHSFNNIADTTGDQISLAHLNQMVLDKASRTVTVGAGVTYSQLCPYLDSHGYALHNLASLPHITAVGACATATHGSGIKNGNLATSVAAMEFVTGAGELVTLSRAHDGDRFRAAVVHLGAMGVLTKITLDIEPAYTMRQVVYQNLSMDQLKDHLDDVFASGYSVSLFTDWQHHNINQVWIKSRVENNAPFHIQPEFFGAKAATRKLHPIESHSAENCTDQMGIPGRWYDRLPHFRINFTPSSGHELQSEYFVPREKGYDAILAVEKLRDRITPHLFITELRTIAADDLWMSTCYERPSMTVHFTWKPEWAAVEQLLPLIEEHLAPFDPRPHWAKVFTLSPALLQSRYNKLPEFREMLAKYDPQGKFRNAYLNRNIYG